MEIIVCGSAVTFKSAFTTEEIERAATYRPNSILLMDDDGVDFYMITGERGAVGSSGICYEAESADGSGRAVVTVPIHLKEGQSAKEAVIEKYAAVIEKIERVEEQVRDSLNGINTMVADIGRKIVVVG